ncbi:redoxin family protein [Mucilaginibacter sp. BT774]|uniref:TlpA family protein disulfide reductase n=1 Tax=Mucilaginibacter sp. BT774 TaxID=3062276 RepID=UPI002675B9A4|nr:redoxin family protein [Mucilaginibacter sp. BT774]MDO3627622.1 redoxin family protein [Mucilaginibacter sp. BT774]
MRRLLIIGWLMFLFSGTGALFWYNEWRYHLPTPVPDGYKPVGQGTPVALNWPGEMNPAKPLFLHFFNPDCPCSRFNIPNFQSIVRRYGSQVNFVIVVMNNDRYTAKEVQQKFKLDVPVLFDQSIAEACGVYSTPQAVLIDTQHKLYYRGNYNRSRYCTDERTNYANMAITGLLAAHYKLRFDPLALRSYGCSLPNCQK